MYHLVRHALCALAIQLTLIVAVSRVFVNRGLLPPITRGKIHAEEEVPRTIHLKRFNSYAYRRTQPDGKTD